tara:strand:- start:11108 stop:12049 length:942 start_codon:yes stop_codon:yes gene_type:complete
LIEINLNKKIYINKAKENWVVDRFRSEWNEYNYKTVNSIYSKNVKIIWIIAPWTWRKLSTTKLNNQKVICTIHHIDEDKFDNEAKEEFYNRDKTVDAYHAISETTKNQIQKLTDKRIYTIPFWINQNIFTQLSNKLEIRKEYAIDQEAYLIGTFQRDTEGYDLKSPKLSKGPDRFLNLIDNISLQKNNLQILLTGKRRNYLIEELKKRKIKFYYHEMVDFKTLNKLYNTLDLYLVTSRYEGGPQAILECGITRTPILSTRVGIAPEILHEKSIFSMENFNKAEPDLDFAYNKSSQLKIPTGFRKFNKMFSDFL